MSTGSMNLGPLFSQGMYASYPNFASFPTNPPDGSLALDRSTGILYYSSGGSWLPNGAPSALTGDISGQILNVENRTYVPTYSASEARTLTTLAVVLESGTCTLNVQIDGVTVTGLSALAITATPQVFTATALRSVPSSGKITAIVSAQTGASNLQFSLKYSK